MGLIRLSKLLSYDYFACFKLRPVGFIRAAEGSLFISLAAPSQRLRLGPASSGSQQTSLRANKTPGNPQSSSCWLHVGRFCSYVTPTLGTLSLSSWDNRRMKPP